MDDQQSKLKIKAFNLKDKEEEKLKVKELKAKYKGYKIVEKGYPDSIPFTMLPKELNDLHGKAYEKALDEWEVKGFKVIEKPHIDINITHLIVGGKKRPNSSYKGILEIYLKSAEPRRKY